MGITDRLLMGPGPSNSYPEVTMALAGPVLGHLDPQFLALLDSTNDRLRQVFATSNALTLPLSGTGSAGMEASFVNFVRPGDPVVVGVNGVFGERMCEVAARHGADVVRVDAEWGMPIDPDRLLAAHPSPSMIAVVHAETSTGVRNDIERLGEGKGDALLLVDMVTSLGGIEVDVDGWSVDIAYSGTQKCLGVPPGLAPFTASTRAAGSNRRSAVELVPGPEPPGALRQRHLGWGTRVPPHRSRRHGGRPACRARVLFSTKGFRRPGRATPSAAGDSRTGWQDLGLELLVAADHRLPQLTTVRIPAGVEDAAVRRELLSTYGIEIGAGAGQLAGQIWRIGCMGHTARRRNVVALLGALKEVLER